MGKGGGCGTSTMNKDPNDEKEDLAPAAETPTAHAVPPPADETSSSTTKMVLENRAAVPDPETEEKGAPEPELDVDVVSESAAVEPFEEVLEAPAPDVPTTKVFIIFYSMYGHIASLAEKVKEGVDSVDGAEGILFQVPETLPEAMLAKMGAPPKPDIPVIEPKDLLEADAVILGIPTRFGMMCAQMKAFFDATGSLWQSQALSGKPAGFFFSSGTQGGGQETTALTAISQLAHHGMLYVPIGYTNPMLFDSEVHGGSPYGAGTFAGDGTRIPLDLELDVAAHQGQITALFAARLKRGSFLE